MPRDSRPRLSRWGKSAYETDADLAAERVLLSEVVDVVGMRQDAEVVVVTSQVHVDAALLQRCPSARLIITTTSGHDHVDLQAAAAAGIRVCRSPLARRDAVIDTALALLLAGARQLAPQLRAAEAGRWARGELPDLGMRTLRGARVGVLGAGVIGVEMIRVLQALRADVAYWDPNVEVAELPRLPPAELVRGSDFLTVHCSLTDASAGLLSAAVLATAPRGAVVVNTARGGVLDAAGAIGLVDTGHLGFVGLDVFAREPYPCLAAAARTPGVWLTPHSAGYHDGLAQMVRESVRRAAGALVQGDPIPYRVA